VLFYVFVGSKNFYLDFFKSCSLFFSWNIQELELYLLVKGQRIATGYQLLLVDNNNESGRQVSSIFVTQTTKQQ